MFPTPVLSYSSPWVPSGSSGKYPYGIGSSGSYSGSSLTNLINFHGGSRTLYWRVDLLNNDRTYKNDITPYTSKLVITADTTRAVGRSLDLDMVETVASQTITGAGTSLSDVGIDYLNDLVMPVAILRAASNRWLWFPLGIFRFTRPGITVPGYAIVRHATMPDFTSVIQENAATDASTGGVAIPFTLPGNERVIDVIRSLLMNSPRADADPLNPHWASAALRDIPGCALGDLLPSNVPGALAYNTPGDFPSIDAMIPDAGYQVSEGQSYLDLINHLLFTLGCYNLMSDERGVFRIQKWPTSNWGSGSLPLPDYTGLSSQYTYDTTSDSIISFGLNEDFLIDDLANVVQVKVEDSNRATFMATAVNADPASAISIINFGGSGRRVVKVISDSQVPEATSGANYAQMYAVQQLIMASWLVDTVQLPIAVNPMHGGYRDHDIVTLKVYQKFYADNSFEDIPVIVDSALDGLTGISDKFIVDGWTITATLATPGSGTNLTGNIGLTTVLEPRETKQGHTMTLTCHRITSSGKLVPRPAYIQVT